MKRNPPNRSKGPSQRQLRVGEQLRHIIAEVRVTPDLKQAKAYVMSLGGADMDKILPALNEDAYVFQKEISRQSNLKFTPKIRFVRDESFDEAQKIDQILRGVSRGADSDESSEEE